MTRQRDRSDFCQGLCLQKPDQLVSYCILLAMYGAKGRDRASQVFFATARVPFGTGVLHNGATLRSAVDAFAPPQGERGPQPSTMTM